MSIGIRDQKSHLGPELSHHLAVCSGEFCASCDAPLRAQAETRRGFRLCTTCWPDSTVTWTALHASIQWSSTGWTLCFCHRTPHHTGPNIAYWLLLHDRAECVAILDRYLCCQAERVAFDCMADHAGHCTIGVFVGPRRLAALAEATRKDPRNGYEKLCARRTRS